MLGLRRRVHCSGRRHLRGWLAGWLASSCSHQACHTFRNFSIWGESSGNGLRFGVSSTERFPPGIWSWLLWLRAVSQRPDRLWLLSCLPVGNILQQVWASLCEPSRVLLGLSIGLRFSVAAMSLQSFPHLPLTLAVFACR